jgi:hypothetical protein
MGTLSQKQVLIRSDPGKQIQAILLTMFNTLAIQAAKPSRQTLTALIRTPMLCVRSIHVSQYGGACRPESLRSLVCKTIFSQTCLEGEAASLRPNLCHCD